MSSGIIESKTHDLITEQLVKRLPALAIKAILQAVRELQLDCKELSPHHLSRMGLCFQCQQLHNLSCIYACRLTAPMNLLFIVCDGLDRHPLLGDCTHLLSSRKLESCAKRQA